MTNEDISAQLKYAEEQIQQQHQSIMQLALENKQLKTQHEYHKSTIARLQTEKLMLLQNKNQQALLEETQTNKNLTIQFLNMQEESDKIKSEFYQLQMKYEASQLCIKDIQHVKDETHKQQCLRFQQQIEQLNNNQVQSKITVEDKSQQILELQNQIQNLNHQLLELEQANLALQQEKEQKSQLNQPSEKMSASQEPQNPFIIEQMMKMFDAESVENLYLKVIKLVKDKEELDKKK